MLSVLLPACAKSAPPDSARPLELMVQNDADTLDPRYATDSVAVRVTRLVHAGLVRLDPTTLEPVPYAARSWSWLDDLTLRVELRDDVRFHSGAPLRPADVVATVRAIQSPKVGSRHARMVDAIESASEDGPRAVVVHLRTPHATLLTDLELPILRADQAEGPADPSGALDGLGPFRVASFERGAIRLEPAEHAALPPPAHAVVVRTVHDENARALRFYAGRADVALNQFSPTLLPALEARPELTVSARPGSNVTYMIAREGRGPLDRADVRRAVSLAIDRALLTRSLLAGYAQPAAGMIPPSHWAHAEGAEPFAFDPARARALLDAAGARGAHLAILTSTDRLRMSITRVFAQELEDVGLVVDVVPLDLGTMIARMNAGDFELAILQMPELTEPHLLRHFLHSDFVPPSGANRGRVHDPELDRAIERGGATRDLAERRAAYAEVERRLRDEVHVIPLWNEDQVAVTSARARAFQASAEGRWLSIASIP